MRSLKKAVCYVLIFVMVFTSVSFNGTLEAQTVKAAQEEYEIYPNPHSTVYGEGSFTLTQKVNVVYNDKIDNATLKKAEEILTIKGQEDSGTHTADTSYTNLLVGIYGSQDAAQQFIGDEADSAHFEKIDSYIVKAEAGTIAVLGKDTDAAFYGLATLKMVLKQINGMEIRNFTVKDYSDTQLRGFIEGYYGLPWSNQNRMDLMKFGGDIKANAYVFAPKDDKYHNSEWRTMYPSEKLAEIKEMVAAGEESKCKFVWTIHPFMSSPVNNANYDESISIIKQKFEQLYGVGVRQFGVLADDAGAVSEELLIKLMNDLNAWCKEKGDVRDILFCPAEYNLSFAGGSYDRLRKLNAMDDEVKFFWTGQSVCAEVSKLTVDNFTAGLTSDTKKGRKPLFWLNWPVNDINNKRMLMGKGELLHTDVTGLEGVITNPMQQSEPSKAAIFAVCDYAWNIAGFDADQSWADSFKYIEPDASDALYTMAKHLSDPSPNGHGLVLGESEELKPQLEAFQALIANNSSVKSAGVQLIAEFEKIIAAANKFEADTKNDSLKEQLSPWTESLRQIATAAVKYIETAIAIEENNNEAVWSSYSEASAAFSNSQKCSVQNKDSISNVQAGSKRIIPFVTNLSQVLSSKVNSIVNPNAEQYTPVFASLIKSEGITGIYMGADKDATDNDSSTYVWYKTKNDIIASGEYIGLDFGREIVVGQIKILQGMSSGNGADDYISQAVLEYSKDGITYTPIGSYQNKKEITADVQELGIRARYIRLRATANINKWLVVRDFTASESEAASHISAYTNVAKLSSREVSHTTDSASLYTNDRDITLKPGQYIGMILPRPKEISELQINYTQKEQLVLETSISKDKWSPQNQEALPDKLAARYIRLINRGTADVTFSLTRFEVKSNEIMPVKFLESNISSGAIETPDNGMDRDRTTKANFQISQKNGQYIIYDLGQKVSVKKVKMVLHDAELDFIRNGEISVSADKQNWTPVVTIGDSSKDPSTVTISDVFPNHEISYYTVEGITDKSIPVTARYLKIAVTKDYSARWIRFNEIEINDGEYLPTEINPSFETSHIEAAGHIPSNLTDGDVQTTFFTDTQNDKNGYLLYHVSDNTAVKSISILQSPSTQSHAAVSVRYGENEWKQIGTLDKSLNIFENLGVDSVYDIKIAWSDVVPELHEMYLTKEEAPAVTPVNKDELLKKYQEAQSYESQYYTQESYAPLEAAIMDAKGVIDYLPAGNEDVEDALAALTQAIAGLIEVVPDETELRAKLEEAYSLDEKTYTKESFEAVTAAAAAAEAVLGKPETNQKMLDQKLAELTEAIEGLVIDGTLSKIPSNQMTAQAGSEEGSGNDGNASAAIDGNETTYWHSNWSGSSSLQPDISNNIRNEFTIDLGKTAILRKLEYVPRANNTNGRILKYKLYYSTTAEGDDFKEIPKAEGSFVNDTAKKEIIFRTVTARRLQIRALSTAGDSKDKFISAAEFYVYEIIPNSATYTATFEGGDQAIGEAPQSIEGKADFVFTLPENTFTKTGYEFIGWSDGKEVYQPGDEYTMPTAPVVFTAQWKQTGDPSETKYTASFEGGEGAFGTAPETIEVTEGSSFQLPENTFVKEGYEFTGWSDGNQIYQPSELCTMYDKSIIFIAQWKEMEPSADMMISFDAGEGGSGTAPDSIMAAAGSVIILPENSFIREGYIFAGWKNGETLLQPGDTYTVPENNIVFTAQWEEGDVPQPTEYTAAFDGGNQVTGQAPQTITAKAGAQFKLPANSFQRPGFVFKGWNDGSKTYQPGSSYTMPGNNVVFQAVWEVNRYQVSFDANGGTVSVKSIMAEEGKAIGKLPVPSRSGYTFNGWFTAKVNGSKIAESTQIRTNMVLYAQWTKIVVVPSKVTGIKASSNKTGSVKISWKRVSNAKGYLVYRYNTKTKKWDKVRTTTATSWTNSGLSYGTVYKYRVKAYNQEGNVRKEGKISSTLTTGTSPLKTSIKVKKYSSKVKVSWTKTTKASGQEVYMKTGNGSYKLIASKSSKTGSYTKTNLKKGKTYTFKVRRYVKAGSKKIYGAYSKTVKVKF